ncbi:MAG: DNA-directed RNA polymerase subunit delta [Veillonellaceae bacterium]|nr:DNA-directed RNA polymerase subunit delta [Veillonellaceae bacterium]MDD6922812.1 DNA-directed RNA polymerase subunit delta [Veillonellaceae bacterium]
MAEEMDYTNKSETDVAYDILQKSGSTMYYKDLVTKVIELKNKPVQSMSAGISEVYTLINMDSRFHYEGDGQWGLTEWNPPEVKRTHGTRSKTRTSSAKKD